MMINIHLLEIFMCLLICWNIFSSVPMSLPTIWDSVAVRIPYKNTHIQNKLNLLHSWEWITMCAKFTIANHPHPNQTRAEWKTVKKMLTRALEYHSPHKQMVTDYIFVSMLLVKNHVQCLHQIVQYRIRFQWHHFSIWYLSSECLHLGCPKSIFQQAVSRNVMLILAFRSNKTWKYTIFHGKLQRLQRTSHL